MSGNTQEAPAQNATAPEADEENGFGEAFAERSADPAGTIEEDGEHSPSDDEPAHKAGSDAAPADAATEQADNGKADAFDPWHGLTDEQKAHFQRIEASERSNRGRVGALTRKLNGLSSTPAPTPTQDKDPKPEEQQGQQRTEGEGEDEATASDLDKRLQDAMEDYGDVIGPVADILKEVRAEVAGLKKASTDAAEIDADAQEITEGLAALEKSHPDYQAVSRDENFQGWLGDQSEQVIGLANSYDPREVSLVLTMFKAERSAALARNPGEGGETNHGGTATTSDRRKRQLEAGRQVPGRGQPAASGTPNDFGAAFKARGKAHAD